MAEKKYGHFDDANREYVITDPKTPWPWINYLGNEDFFSLISNTAGGYSFYKDAKFRRITRYRYNGVPMDNGGRYFYIKDGDTVWNPGWKPCKTPLDSYECRHGMNYTRITGSKNGVEASVLFFVPLHTWAEVQKMTLKNQTEEVKTLKVFSFAEWCLWNAATDMENFQRNFSTGEVEVEGCDGRQATQQFCPRLEPYCISLYRGYPAARREPRPHLPAGLCGERTGQEVQRQEGNQQGESSSAYRQV